MSLLNNNDNNKEGQTVRKTKLLDKSQYSVKRKSSYRKRIKRIKKYLYKHKVNKQKIHFNFNGY